MHRKVNIHQCHKKKLLEKYYNKSKVGVDALDQMARYHTCKSSSRRWPMAVFFNILDCACINSYIVYCSTTKVKLSGRQFLFQLIKELCKPIDGVGSPTHYPTGTQMFRNVLPANTAEANQARKRRSASFCHMETGLAPSARTARKSAMVNKHPQK